MKEFRSLILRDGWQIHSLRSTRCDWISEKHLFLLFMLKPVTQLSFVEKDRTQVAKPVGRDARESGRSKPKAQEQSKKANRSRNPAWRDHILAYQGARERGYTRCFGCFTKTERKLQESKPKRDKKKRKNKPYQRAEYPGQKVQSDVRFVPGACVTDGKKY